MFVNAAVVLAALVASVAIIWYFFAPRKAARAGREGEVQTARIVVKGGYTPQVVDVEAGTPVRLRFDRQEDGECSSHVVFSDLGIDRTLPAFETTDVEFTPSKPGDLPYACGMNMLHGMVHVLPKGAKGNG
ncbi:cupredoxin domain-containing protein [Bifidobacterium sp. ESL0763]|uniref:cupredoxin domain-containing protein n=1 Tax=Bifidobacterium sp. ESL0763 TaxID=2983227 RepID=UPI0023F9A4D2|nr:cupredoxin domain-containing protein [Bifidobacterium sp. ESL0763]MDF7664228.1 cupredoxin domain-containing protein [Bifidobacterium sp. ESL0763]